MGNDIEPIRRGYDDSWLQKGEVRMAAMKNEELGPTQSQPQTALGLGIEDEYVPLHAHVAYFWETDQEFAEAVGFLEVGLRSTDHCVVFGHEEANQAVCRILRERGFDVEALQTQRRLTVLGGQASGDAILSAIAADFEQATAQGAPLIRFLGNIGWYKPNWPDEADLLAFEAKVTDATKQFPCVVVCLYDVRTLSGRIVHHGGFETHPLIIREDSVHKNPYYVPTDMFLEHLEAVAADISERRRAEETLRVITEGTAAVTGSDFFRSLVRHLAQALRVRYAFVAECTDKTKIHARTLAFWAGEDFAENIDYLLRGTPCESVVSGDVCCYPERLQMLFPEDKILVVLKAESYLGVPLLSSSGDILGHLVVMDDKPLTATPHEVSILRIFAARAGMELERKRAEEALRQTAAELRFVNDLIEQTTQPVAVADFDGRLVRFNHAYEQLTGYSAEELYRMTYQQLTPEYWLEFEKQQIARLMAEGQPVRYEKEYRRKDGALVPLELVVDVYRTAAGEPVYLYAFVTDITERKQAEEALRKSEERFRTLFESAPIGISINNAEGRFIQVNRSFQEMLRYTEDELRERSFKEITFAEDLAESKNVFGELVEGKRKEFRLEKRYQKKDGSLMWANTSCSAIRDANGKFIYTFAMIVDITKRKQAEEALRAALAEVEELKNRLQAENIYLQEEIKTEHNFEEIVGASTAIKKVFQNIEKVARTDSTVLIIGETGTGKELVARAIHNLSSRSSSALIKVNCAALPSGLIESELFGHEKGAFTGAVARKKGRFELADGGTIFLDEVGELPLETQVKLLRVLQEQEFERVGGSQTLKVDVRVIAATNRNLEEVVKLGAFRTDLFYRLNIFPIHLPALRERRDDIALLTNYFASKFSRRMGKKIDRVSPKALETLMDYDWPGNVRELANVLERAVILCDGGVLQPDYIGISEPAPTSEAALSTLEEAERQHILRALEKTNWVVGGSAGAAKLLGLNRTTLLAKMKKLGLEKATPS
jgi:PAS domain S-box-containing protein